METPEGARSFLTSGNAYDAYMGRYPRLLADLFADAAGVGRGQTALDVGCGPGALAGVLVERLGAWSVFACDPSAPFVAESACAEALRGGERGAYDGGVGCVEDAFDDGVAVEHLPDMQVGHGRFDRGRNPVALVEGFGVDSGCPAPGHSPTLRNRHQRDVIDQHVDVTLRVGGPCRGEHVEELVGLIERQLTGEQGVTAPCRAIRGLVGGA